MVRKQWLVIVQTVTTTAINLKILNPHDLNTENPYPNHDCHKKKKIQAHHNREIFLYLMQKIYHCKLFVCMKYIY